MNIKSFFFPGRNFRILTAILIAASLLKMSDAVATNYYVSAGGSDASDGLTPGTSWLTIEKVNNTKFLPGDSILFKRGDAWREGQALYGLSNGTAGHPVVFGAYGKGPKPMILASRDISAPSFWTKSSDNIWKTTSIINITVQDLSRTGHITPDVANLIFNNEKSAGFKKRYREDLKNQGDFCLNLKDTILYLYSTINPSEFYEKIEATGIRNCENNIEVINGQYITFTGLDIRYSKNNGLFLSNCSHIEIKECDFSWIGGCYYPIQTFMHSDRPNPVRMGNGVQLWRGNSDVDVHHCFFNQVYDAGISPQGTSRPYEIRNLRFHHNLIMNCYYSFEFWGRPSGSTGDSIFFENNTCLYAGQGWSTAQRPDKGGSAHLKFFSSDMVFSNIFIRNNIFYESADYCLYSQHEYNGSNTGAMWAAFTLDHNCYFKSTDEKPVIRWRGGTEKGGGDYFMNGLEAYRAQSGKELHSFFTDPGISSDYSLKPSSMLVDAGFNAGFSFSGSAPDIGAFEFQSNSDGMHIRNKKLDLTPYYDTLRVLRNPHKGWCHHLIDNGTGKYGIRDDSLFFAFPGMDHLYIRMAWSYLEPEEGKFDWSYIDQVVEKYVSRGYGISFRISCSETGTYPGSVGEESEGVQYATPSWVRKAGAKGTIAKVGRAGTLAWVPHWEDPVFLEKLDRFHRAFAKKYDGKPWMRYVDVGSIGDWGEGHTSSSTKIPPTVQEVRANMDVYLKNYRSSQLVVCDDLLYYGKKKEEVEELYRYAIAKGITLRDDSPLVDWYIKTMSKTWSVSHPHFYDPLYLRKPVVYELEHYRMVKNWGNWLGKNGSQKLPDYNFSGATIMRESIKSLHATYIGYHGFAEDWLADNPELTAQLANLCGYWYFPVTVTLPVQFSPGANHVSLEWFNKGVAPAYSVFSLIFRFEAKKPENSFDLVLSDSGNRNWLPGKNQVENYLISIPEGAAKGKYRVSFKLVEIKGDVKNDIQLGIRENATDGEGFIRLGRYKLR